ncbi:hypothetical protein [Maribacter sp. IgM3_T14_3]|uniref:hypothetical protein n=1 Tax=Maribacter sp. IgM3_T14_3 TaxID=3415140 RepID=UPI003C6FB077
MKKWVKITVIVLSSLLLIAAAGYGYLYYTYKIKYVPSKDLYKKRVAYIDTKKALFSENFKICDSTRIVDYYNYAPGDSIHRRTQYTTNKNGLRKEVLSKYVNKDYKDSGYLNFRFIVNCKGEAGAYVIHENDLDLHPKKFNTNLVSQLLNITVELKKWKPNYMYGAERDSYMYISYRIENGEITEIIP